MIDEAFLLSPFLFILSLSKLGAHELKPLYCIIISCSKFCFVVFNGVHSNMSLKCTMATYLLCDNMNSIKNYNFISQY